MLLKRGFHPAIGWLVITTMLLIVPGEDLPNEKWLYDIHADKLAHIIMFGVMVYLFNHPVRHKLYNALPWITLACFAYGVTIEFIQDSFTMDRKFDWWDIVSDGIGCLGGYTYAYLRKKRRHKRKHRRKSKSSD